MFLNSNSKLHGLYYNNFITKKSNDEHVVNLMYNLPSD